MINLGSLLLIIGALLGLVSIPFGFPGTAIIFVCALVYALLTGFHGAIGWPLLIVLGILTVIGETADNWLTAAGAKRYGASKTSMWLSFFGGLFGAIVLGSPLAFVAGPLGPVLGGFAGAFGIVVGYEYSKHKNLNDALKAGWGTFVGRMAGMVLKVVIAVGMIVAVAIAVG